MNNSLDDFERWLEGRRFAASTIVQARIDAARILRELGAGETPSMTTSTQRTARRLVRWAQETPEGALAVAAVHETLRRLAERSVPEGKRVRAARSFSLDDWRRLWHAVLDDESPAARVLELMMPTALRVGDVLRIKRGALERALTSRQLVLTVKGGRERSFPLAGVALTAAEKLALAWPFSRMGEHLYEWLCPVTTDRRAWHPGYQQVRRKLLALGGDFDAEGRLNTHRIRRTVAVQALAASQDASAVQQLLGHTSIKTTLGYLDEERPEEVAALSAAVQQLLK